MCLAQPHNSAENPVAVISRLRRQFGNLPPDFWNGCPGLAGRCPVLWDASPVL